MAQDVLSVPEWGPPTASRGMPFLAAIVSPPDGWQPRDPGDVPATFEVVEHVRRRFKLKAGLKYLQEFNSDASNLAAGKWAVLLRGTLRPVDYSKPREHWSPPKPTSRLRSCWRKLVALFSRHASNGV